MGERRTEIIDAAASLLMERGYRGVSVQDIADRANVTKAGLRHHFPAKADILLALLEDRDRRLLELIQTSVPESSPRALIDAVVRVNARNRSTLTLFYVLEAESLDAHNPAHPYFLERAHQARNLFRQGAAGLPRPELAADETMAFLRGIELSWVHDEAFPYLDAWNAFADRLYGPAEVASVE